MISFDSLEGIEVDRLRTLDAGDFLSQELLFQLYDIRDLCERERVKQLLILVAREKGVEKPLLKLLKANDIEEEKAHNKFDEPTMYSTQFSIQPFSLNCGEWNATDNGIFFYDGHRRKAYASRIPVMPVALIENVSTGTEKVKLIYEKNGLREIICDRSVIAGNFKIVSLADQGLEVTSENAKFLVRFLSECISLNLNAIPTYKSASQLGWNRYGFTPYVEDVIFDGEKENGALYRSIESIGDYELWKAETRELRENLFVRLIMNASFASALIEKINALPFVFHLWGTSGSGKTVALMVAMSIWGNPAIGKLVRTMNMTQNAMMNTASFLNSIPFAGDELQTVKSRWENYDTLIMRVCEGIDRGRMSFDKTIEPKTWNCAFLFTGEEPCTKADSGGGVKNRVIDCEIAGKLFDSPNSVVNFVAQNYGFAGKEFTDYILNETSRDELNERFNEIQCEILNRKDTTEKQAASMALIMLADEIVGKCIYTNQSQLEFDDILPFLANANEVDISERAYEFIINHVAQNAGKFSASGYGEIWGDITDTEITINSLVLKRELSANGFDFDSVKKRWRSKGYIILSSDNRYTHNTSCNGVKARYIKIKTLDADSNEPGEEVEADEELIF